MRTLLLTNLVLLNIQIINSQNRKDEKYRFAKEAFKSENYKYQDYPKYDNEIIKLENNTYQFGDKFLTIELEKSVYENIFKLGIFNPDIVFGKETTKKTKAELDSLNQNQRVIYNLIRNDSLTICCFEELEKLNPNSQTKRFKFWLFNVGLLNPTEYYIELFNKNATKETSIDEFIENSRMTFFFKGTVIL